MIKKTFLVLALICVCGFLHSQSVLDLGTGSQVRNSIIFDNPGGLPVVSGVSVTFSASDSVLPTGSNNLHLLSSPFSSGFRINSGSSVFDMGNHYYLGAFDTLDLDGNARFSCRNVDIGAFEYMSVPVMITVQPFLADRVCAGESVELVVEAVGYALSFQWQRNGVDIPGATDSIFTIPFASFSDTGYYRVFVSGACNDDTSALVRLDVDLRPMVVAMNDTTISLGQPVTLYVLDSVGTISWLASDSLTVVTNLLLTNLTESSRFFAVASNGVCADTSVSVDITVKTELIVELNSWDGCFIGDGWAEFVSSSGERPFTFLWSNGSPDSVIENLIPGTYTLTVTDAFNVSGTASVIIDSVVGLQISYVVTPASDVNCSNGSISITVSGGYTPLFFDWSSLVDPAFESESQNLSGVSEGVYHLLVTDSRGCRDSVDIEVTCGDIRVRASMLLTPNDDGKNDFVYIRNIEHFPNNRVTFISSYGEEIITIQNYDNQTRFWGGRNRRGQLVPDGTYYYIIEAEGMTPISGWIIVRLSGGR